MTTNKYENIWILMKPSVLKIISYFKNNFRYDSFIGPQICLNDNNVSFWNNAQFFSSIWKDGSIGPGGGAISKTKKSLKKVNLAVVKQRKKDMGNLELLKTLDEYVSARLFH